MSPTAAIYLRAIARALRPDEKVSISDWAAKYRVLPPDTPEPGPWRNERTPYLVDIMDTMSPGSAVREGWVMKGHQVGGSACGENFIGAAICTAAGSILVVFSTIEDAKQWELQRFEEMRRSTRELRRRVRDADATGANNTKLRKKYPGGVMRLVSANRVGALKSATIRYVKFEEPDEYVLDLDDQGNPIDLAKKRTSNFGRRAKIYGDGTPTIEGRSAIEKQFGRGDRRRWFIPCPSCGHAQVLDWARFKWDAGEPDSVKHYCEACGEGFAEHAWKARSYARTPGMTEAQAREAGLAHWRSTADGERGVASWHLPSLIAPVGWRPWSNLAAEYDAALEAEKLGDTEARKTFANNELGVPWAETLRAAVTADKLRQRRENYPLFTCPAAGLVVVASVDTQDNRLAVEVRAYGRGEESWGLHHGEIWGSPASTDTWVKVRELLEAPIRHISGQMIRVDAAAIDAGGHFDAEVKLFCRDAQARGRHWFAIRGAPAYRAQMLGKPRTEEINFRGKPVPGGAQVRYVGTQQIKNLLHNRLMGIEKHGPGFVHWPLGYADDYFDQLVAEKRERRRDRQGNAAYWWVKAGARNEAWDLLVYGYAAFLYAMTGRHAEAVWRERERIYGSQPQIELLDQSERADEAAAVATAASELPPAALIRRGRRGSLSPSFRR
jgi:phage terminase large subunit GpA-like protein